MRLNLKSVFNNKRFKSNRFAYDGPNVVWISIEQFARNTGRKVSSIRWLIKNGLVHARTVILTEKGRFYIKHEVNANSAILFHNQRRDIRMAKAKNKISESFRKNNVETGFTNPS